MRQGYDAPRPVAPVKASFKALRRDRGDEYVGARYDNASYDSADETAAEPWKLVRQRRGLLGWWLDLTAPPPAPPSASLKERERVRRAELSGYVTFAVLALGLLMLPNALQNRPTLISTGVIVVAGIAAGWLNRTNRTLIAAVLLVGVLFITIGGAMATSPNLDLVWMPALDFFAVPVILAGLLISRRAPFAAAVVGTAAVVALVALKPRDPGLTAAVAQLGAFHFMLRPILLQAVMALIAWLWAGSVEHAIARADRAEEVAAMEHELAEQKDKLEVGIQDLLETHVRVANGDFAARAHTSQDNLLWQIAVSLNNLLARLGKFAQVDARLQHTEAEIDRLAAAMEHARNGRGAAWPAPSGTRVDMLLRQLTAGAPARGQFSGRLGTSANGARATGHPAPPSPGIQPGAASGVASGLWTMPGNTSARAKRGMAGAPVPGAPYAQPAASANGASANGGSAAGARPPAPTWDASGVRPLATPPATPFSQQQPAWPRATFSGHAPANHATSNHAGYGPARMPMPEPHAGTASVGSRATGTWRAQLPRTPWRPAGNPGGRDPHPGTNRQRAREGQPQDHGAPGEPGARPSAATQWPSEPLPALPPSPWPTSPNLPTTPDLPWDGPADWSPEPSAPAHGLVTDPAIELTTPRQAIPVTGQATPEGRDLAHPPHRERAADPAGVSGIHDHPGLGAGAGAISTDDDEPWPDWPALLRRWAQQPAPPDPSDRPSDTDWPE